MAKVVLLVCSLLITCFANGRLTLDVPSDSILCHANFYGGSHIVVLRPNGEYDQENSAMCQLILWRFGLSCLQSVKLTEVLSNRALNTTDPLLFDAQDHGPKLEILDNGMLARRYEGCCYSVGFSNRHLHVNETMKFEIEQIESGWIGNLNVGIIYTDPFSIRDLVTCDANVSMSLNHTRVFIFERFYTADNRYMFHVDGKGVAHLTPNVTETGEVFYGVDVSKPFWAIFNVFGQTKAVRLLN